MLYRLWEAAADAAPRVVGGHLLVSSYALIKEVLTDPETYRPDNALDAVTPIPVAALRILTRYGFRLPPTLANNGTPSHPGLRAAVAEALHPHRVAALRPWLTGVVRRRVARLATELRRGEKVDLDASLAADLPLLALARLIELPAVDAAAVKEFSRAALELFWAPLDPDRQEALAATVGRYHAALRATVRTRKGLAGRLRATGGTEDEAVAALFFLVVAGQETTSQFLTLLLHRLCRAPAVLDDLAGGRITAADIVEEGLRREPPIVSWRRVAARDATLGGVPVEAGSSVLLWLAAASRDGSRHLAFGAGAHRCLGATLARMEAAVVVAEAAPLLRRLRVIEPPHCPDNLSFRMPSRLIVEAAGADPLRWRV